MTYSLWEDTRGYRAVSVNQDQPGSVAGYLIPVDEGWLIENDSEAKVYPSLDEGAREIIRRYTTSN